MKTHLSRRNIISIDVESNGLYGQPFCVGAVEMDWGGRVYRHFLGRCPLDEVEDDWVLENVIPALEDIEETHKSLGEMQRDFVSWLCDAMARNKNAIVLVDAGFPVDCNFLYNAIRSGSSESGHKWIREKYSPYPLIDLASVLAGAGLDPDANRIEMASSLTKSTIATSSHHPVWDAETSAVCLVLAIRKIEACNA